jgi:uncharacterized membrane protein
MPILEENIIIKCPVDKVFAFTADLENWSKWQTTAKACEQTSQGQMGIGATFKWITNMMGLKIKTTAKVTGYELNKKWSKHILSGSTVIDDYMFFDFIDGGTKFTIRYDMKVSGFLKLFSPMIVSSTRKAMKEAVNNLKNTLETQA